MSYITSVSLLHFLVVVLQSAQCEGLRRVFWRRQRPTQALLPSEKNNEIYRKLREEIPPKNETAHKLVTNFLRIRPRNKRSPTYEDTVIVMDGSGSIGYCEFCKGKEAAGRLVGIETPGVDARVAMVTFASDVRRDFNFSEPSVAATKVRAVTYPSGWTNIQAGLAEATKLFRSARGLARKVVLLFTDGQSNKMKEKTIPNANALKNFGVEIFVVAIGDQHFQGIYEMAHMATYPPQQHLFRVKTLGDFLHVVNLAIKEVAPGEYAILDKNYKAC